jgi:hypothetical protein
VEWLSATEEANFFNYLATNPQLNKWAGKIVPRNSAYAPWQETVNLHAEQEIPIWRNVRVTVFGDCYNFSNLIDKHSGIVDNFNGSFMTQTIAGTGFDAAKDKYIYTFNPARWRADDLLGPVALAAADRREAGILSPAPGGPVQATAAPHGAAVPIWSGRGLSRGPEGP